MGCIYIFIGMTISYYIAHISITICNIVPWVLVYNNPTAWNC